ncbi:SusE domain-containing protein [Bacteroides sp.]|uniref:SusE domain-containing protein n=1 Tax=Bacteroides sp. TaxID=29523 RepID=UPI002617C589|nr:SusE domain-containing protein [Bacteroides sp.]
MKFIKSISASIVALLLCTACESDLEKTVYTAGDATPAVLSALNDQYVLQAKDAANEAFILNWSKPEAGYQASIINSVEMDVKGKSFANKAVLASSKTDVSYTITVSNLNSKIISLLKKYEMEVEPVAIELRISSSISAAADTIYSNVISTTITPYQGEPDYPSIALRGDYNGWDFAKSQKVYSVDSNNKYAAMVYFDGKAANGWKFCGASDWSTDNWGAPEGMTVEQSPVTLVSGNGGDIKAYGKNSYYLEFNNSTGELKVSKAYTSWGIVGDYNSWGNDGNKDTVMTLATETDENNKFQYYLKATVNMAADSKWKIRPEEKWENDIAPSAVTGEFEDAGDGNFKVSTAGSYTIKWYFNKVTPKVIVTKNN